MQDDFRQAIRLGYITKFDLLLDKAVITNYEVELASQHGRFGMLQKLLYSDVDPSVNTNHAINMASMKGNLAIVDLLLGYPRVRENLYFAFYFACEYGRLEVLKRLLHYYNPINDQHALSAACANGYLAVVKVLLKVMDPSIGDNNALYVAAKYGRLAIVNLLLCDKRVDPSFRAIDICFVMGHTKVVNRLLDDRRVACFIRDYTFNNNPMIEFVYRKIEKNLSVVDVLKSNNFYGQTHLSDDLVNLILEFVFVKYIL
jgi:ankyrin repeat protein